jgi:hypothetical protein
VGALAAPIDEKTVARAPDQRDDLAKRSDFVGRWTAGLLKSPEQLPDVKAKKFTHFWDTDHDTQKYVLPHP